MHEFQIPTRHIKHYPDALKDLSAHLDLNSKEPGIIGFGMAVDPPDYDSVRPAHPAQPFFLVRAEDGAAKIIRLHLPEGRALLADCTFVDQILLTISDGDFHAFLTMHLNHIYSYDFQEDEVYDDGPSGDVEDCFIITDGRLVAAWNPGRDLNNILACHQAADEDDAEDIELECVDDFICVLVPEAETSHELVKLTSVMEGPVRLINEIVLSNSDSFKFIFDPRQA